MTKKEARRLAKFLLTAPKVVKIGPSDFDIKFVNGWAKGEDGKNYWGHFIPGQQLLEIAVPEEVRDTRTIASTVWHELLHGFWFISRLGNKATEENAVRCLEHSSVAFFRDNPEFMSWLLKGIK